jgi:predicted transcriptional regulator
MTEDDGRGVEPSTEDADIRSNAVRPWSVPSLARAIARLKQRARKRREDDQIDADACRTDRGAVNSLAAGTNTMVKDWSEVSSPEERVRTIAETMQVSRRVEWVAEQAGVNEDAAQKVLESMVNEGVLATWEADPEGRVYTVNEGRQLMAMLCEIGEETNDGGIYLSPDVVDEMETAHPDVDEMHGE